MNQMSTGDQSEYLRRKMAERRQGYDQGGQFMKSGYQKWAENERPARQGGAMKDGLETARDGGAKNKDILDRVKEMGEDMFSQFYKGSSRHIQGGRAPMMREEGEDDELAGMGYSGNGAYTGMTCPPSHPIDDGITCRQPLRMEGFVPKGGEVIMKPRRTPPSGSGMSGGAFTIERKDDGRFCVMEDDEELGRFESMARAKAFVKAQRDARKAGVPAGPPRGRKPRGKGLAGKVAGKVVEHGVNKALEGKGTLKEHAADLVKMSKESHRMPDGSMMAGPMCDVAKKAMKGKGKMVITHHEEGEGTEVRNVGSGKRNDRAALVKKVMKEKGLSLPAASKYVKEHGLYKK